VLCYRLTQAMSDPIQKSYYSPTCDPRCFDNRLGPVTASPRVAGPIQAANRKHRYAVLAVSSPAV